MKILLSTLLLISLETMGQKPSPKLSMEILKFCDRVGTIYGKVFIDTTYNKCDTLELSKSISRGGLGISLSVVELLKMKCTDFNFNSISTKLKNIVSKDSFFRMKDDKPSYTSYELTYNKKLDSVMQLINSKRENSSELPNDVKEVESLLVESSYWNRSLDSQRKSKSKLLKILSIFESKDYFLIVYTISELHSTLHTLPYCELIIK